MAQLLLASLKDTDIFTGILAGLLAANGYPPVFLYAPLGAGKTTLVSALVAHFRHGGQAEVASPSFTICNLYPVLPPMLHCDLYRCRSSLPDEIFEFMDEAKGQLVVEWAEYFPQPPEDRLDIFINVVNDTRWLEATGHGAGGIAVADGLLRQWRAVAGEKMLKC